ncbi:MAG: hypothetical protein ABIT08_06680 [Bacteroidia bacterium]
MKTTRLILFVCIISCISCSKDKTYNAGNGTGDHYVSLLDFYDYNGVKSRFFTINASSGGNFTTQQGTVVTIPAYAFINNTGDSVYGNVTIEFKDIYKKSDMLLSDKNTAQYGYGSPIKSAGEFYIRASVNNQPVLMNYFGSKVIRVTQPALLAEMDPAMEAFIGVQGVDDPLLWRNDSVPGSVTPDSTLPGYIFTLYQFSPIQSDSGTWCNSDNQIYFAAYPQVILTMHQTNVEDYNTDVFLVFKTVKSIVHVYKDNASGNYPYNYAPDGLECTVVAIGEKDGKIYSSFTPITIINNLTVNFTMASTTTPDFKAALEALN